MGLNTKIIDGRGTSNELRVNSEGALPVLLHSHPPEFEDIIPFPFREYFVDDNGSNDMRANGILTPTKFSIKAIESHDIYIRTLSINIGDDGSPALNKFGALTALTNGIEWSFHTQANGTVILHEAVKTNLDFIRAGVETGAIGSGTDAYLADTSGGGTEKNYLPVIDIGDTFGMTWGLKLRKGSKDVLTFKIQDDLTSLVTFNIIGYGIKL